MQVAGGGHRFDFVEPLEIVHRFGVEAERGGIEQIADMLARIDRSGARQAESGFQTSSTTDPKVSTPPEGLSASMET